MDLEPFRQQILRIVEAAPQPLLLEELRVVVDQFIARTNESLVDGRAAAELLKAEPQLAARELEDAGHGTLLEAIRYAVGDYIKEETWPTVLAAFAGQFGSDFNLVNSINELLRDVDQTMEAYWPTDVDNVGDWGLRKMMDDLNRIKVFAPSMASEPYVAKHMVDGMKIICMTIPHFQQKFMRRWQLAHDASQYPEAFDQNPNPSFSV